MNTYREQFVEIRNLFARMVHKFQICANHEFDEFMNSYREQFVEIRNLFARMVHKFQICANHAQCIASIRIEDVSPYFA